MVIGDINAKGGLLGRHLELRLEDGATDDAIGGRDGGQAGRAGQRRRRLRRHLQLHAAGHQGRGRRRRARRSTSTRSSTRAGSPIRSSSAPAPGRRSRSTVHPVADARDRGEDVLLPVGRLHLAPRAEQARAGGRHRQRRVDRRRGVLPARPHGLRRDGREDQLERRRRGVQHDRAARRLAVLRGAPRLRLREPRRTPRLHVLRRELPEHGAGRSRRGPLRLPRLLPGHRRPVQPEAARAVRRALPGRREVHGRQRVLGPVPRAAPVGGCRGGSGLARAGRRDRARWITRRSTRAPGAPRPSCPASTTCA